MIMSLWMIGVSYKRLWWKKGSSSWMISRGSMRSSLREVGIRTEISSRWKGHQADQREPAQT